MGKQSDGTYACENPDCKHGEVTWRDFINRTAPICNGCKREQDEAVLAGHNEARRTKRFVRHAEKVLANSEKATAANNERLKAERDAARAKREAEKERARNIAKEKRKNALVLKRKRAKAHAGERELAARELARRHLLPFILRMKPGYIPGWVHKDICLRLEKFAKDVQEGREPRLMLQMPPRHGKSEIASINFPAWYLGQAPDHEIISCSYAGSLALSFSRKVRQILRDGAFHALFPKTVLDKDNQNAEGWITTQSGGYVPAGVGGPITGKGAHILIIDDPVKNAEEAESESTRQSIKDWYTSTAYTRLAPGGGVLIIQTRWHDDDLSGWLETLAKNDEGDVFEIIRYPAIAEVNERYRRKDEPLHAERYPIEALLRIMKAVGPRYWQALYQQNPVAEEGNYFTRDMFGWFEEGQEPELLTKYTAWDLAIGKGDRNDWTVGVTVGIDKHENMWVLDMRRGRWDSFQIVEQMIDVFNEFDSVITGIEKGQIQMAIGPFLEQRIAEENLFSMHVEGLATGRRDKEARARAIQGRMAQGRVLFPRGAPWLEVMMAELLRFPNGTHDDCVDALAWIGLMLQEMTKPFQPRENYNAQYNSGWRKKLRKYVDTARGGSKSHMTA